MTQIPERGGDRDTAPAIEATTCPAGAAQFRGIDLSGLQAVRLAPQAAPQLLWIDVAQLVVDEAYQRPLAKANLLAIQRIANEFQWSRFAPVLVAPAEGGRYALIDGQHRAHAAALCGIRSLPAMVVMIPPGEQALAFIDINTRRIGVRAQNVYRAALAAGQPWAVEADRVVTAAGCRLMTHNASTAQKRPGQVYAVDLIRKLIEAKAGAAVQAGLTALMAYDPEATPNFSDSLLDPWLNAVACCGVSDAAVLERALRSKRPWLVIEMADKFAKAEGQAAKPCRRDAFMALIRQAAQKGGH